MDPAALGTTRIGLDHIRREQARDDLGADGITVRDPHPVRRLAAAALRRAAARLDPGPTTARTGYATRSLL